jgi:hypothetical protein
MQTKITYHSKGHSQVKFLKNLQFTGEYLYTGTKWVYYEGSVGRTTSNKISVEYATWNRLTTVQRAIRLLIVPEATWW